MNACRATEGFRKRKEIPVQINKENRNKVTADSLIWEV